MTEDFKGMPSAQFVERVRTVMEKSDMWVLVARIDDKLVTLWLGTDEFGAFTITKFACESLERSVEQSQIENQQKDAVQIYDDFMKKIDKKLH